MSGSDRQPYLTATTLDQDLLDECHDNLTCQLELIVDIETPTGYIYASDRNKYVGTTFYEALLTFPVINRTVGEWLAPALEFSTLTLELNNADGRLNKFLPAGADFAGWIGKTVEVKLGLRDVSSTYFRVFKGRVTDVGGFSRSVKSITVVARDDFAGIDVQFPTQSLTRGAYLKLHNDISGQMRPLIYGDWTTNITPQAASVPGIPVNTADPMVDQDITTTVTIGIGTNAVFSCADHFFEHNDPVKLSTTGALPSPLVDSTVYYVEKINDDNFYLSLTPGGARITTSGAQSGGHTVQADETSTPRNLIVLISENVNREFDTTNVFLFRDEIYYRFVAADVVNVDSDLNQFELKQNSTTLVQDGETYRYKSSDVILVRVKGKAISGGYHDNIVAQAKDILVNQAGVLVGDLHANWDTYRDKASPTESAISTFKSRVWIQEPESALQYVLSMLEQVRLEAFINRDLEIKLNSLHLDDFVAAPTHKITNWDIVKDSFEPKLDDKYNFNRAQGAFNFIPELKENAQKTPIFKNTAAINQAGKAISKQIVFPNLYEETVVNNQIKEILRLSSSYFEIIETKVTWRSLLKDIGDFVKIDVKIGATQFTEVPGMIREIGYDPEGLRLPIKIWSFQMTPFTGWSPGYAGIVGGSTATITQE